MKNLATAMPAGAVDQKVRLALLGQLFAATPQPVTGGILFAGVVAIIVSDHAPATLAWGWFAVKAAIGTVRIAQVRRFLATPVDASTASARMRSYMLWSALDVVTWAAMLPLFGASADTRSLTLLVCGLLGVASLGAFTTIPYWPVCALFSTVCLGTITVWFALRGLPGDWAVAAGGMIYLALLALESRRGHAHMVEMVRLRYENAALAEERAAALAAAQSSDAAKSRFLAMVSHEMRTPLNGIMGMVQVLRAEIVDPARARSLALLENSARLLARIIGDLLDLARMEAGTIDLQPQNIDQRQTIDQVVALLQPLARQRGLVLQAHWPEGVPGCVLGDGNRVGQVLHNLIGNAIKFTEQGRIDVRVGAGPPGLWRVDVVDTGPGIAVTDQQRIFEAFERVGDVGLVPGTGLGLPIARRLARAMGGDVTCDSTPGHGSTFSFRFEAPGAAPCAMPPDRQTGHPTPGVGATASAPAGGSDPRAAGVPAGTTPDAERVVLVVDDNEVNTLVAGALLEQLGWRHESVGDGLSALRAMAQTRYAAVLMDCHMPLLDGWEATRRWRREERGSRLPIIGITANASAEDRRSCLEAGMDDHLPKPFDKDALDQALRRLAGRDGS